MKDEFAQFVIHPRFGQQPRITGLNPENDLGGGIFLHWHSPDECRIPNTAVPANPRQQVPATVPVTHYFDVKRECRDCGRPFIFFAEEQKYWYEELGFGLDSDCVRCPSCRKKQQGVAQGREKYEELFHIPDRSFDQDLEMAECCLGLVLVEESVFHAQQLQRARILLNRMPPEPSQSRRTKLKELSARLLALEAQATARKP